MKKLKSISLALLFVLTVSITMNNGQTLTLSPIVKQGTISVTKGDDTVTVTNDLVEIVISTGGDVGGVRPIKWTVTATGLELAANAQPSYEIGNRYPLWDWIANQDWAENELCLGTYETNATDSDYAGSVSISFEYDCTDQFGTTGDSMAGLKVIKVLTFYQDKYYFDMQVIFRNPTTGDIKLGPPDWADVGYNINAVGYLEPISNLYQGYQDGLTPFLGLNFGMERRDAKELQWVAVYNVDTGATIALKPYNATSTVQLEGGRGTWGSETRIEYPPVTMAPGSQVAYVLKVYGGPPDLDQLTEIDMSNLAAGVAFSAEMDSDFFVYLPNQTCKYTLNLTNKLSVDLTEVEVNVTFRESNQYESLGKKIFDVDHWTGFTLNAKSTLNLAGNVTLASPPLPITPKIYCLHAQVYQEGKSLASLVLLIPVIADLTYFPMYKPLTVSLVWNLQQPYLIDSPALSVWPSTELPGGARAFLTTSIQDYVEEGSKPYLLHALLLDKYPSVNVTFNLQPTLLYQWNVSASDKWWYWWDNIENPLTWEKGQEKQSEACGEAIEKYKSLASSGRIELLASPYYHPVMPILLAKNWTDDLVDQLELGENYIQELMEVEPTGLWVPELAFNMSLVPIINDTGLQYIVLDHRMLEASITLPRASFEPWYVQDTKTNKTVIAFFRTRFTDPDWEESYDICNRLATDFSTSSRPSEAARQFIACLYSIWTAAITKSKVVTVALDEWVSTGGPAANKTLENIYSALQQCSYWIETKTLKDALKDVPPTKTVNNLVEGWIENVTSLAALIGEPNSTVEKLWENVTLARQTVMDYSETLSAEKRATDEKLKTALKYLYIAETSDWFKGPDETIGPITGRQQSNSYLDAIKQLFETERVDIWKQYGVYILGGSAIAVIALVAVVAYWRRKKIKTAPK